MGLENARMIGEVGSRRPLPGWLASLLARLANPLASKELLARMRGPRTFVIATLLLLPLAAVAGILYTMIASAASGDVSSNTPVGKLFFAAVTAVELGLICLLAPALTADLISGERERRTLDLLLVTPLSRRQIVVGKLVAALGSLLLLIVLALPIQAIAVLIGGIGLEELLVGLLLLSLTATTYGCVGLYWSARLRTTRGAMLFSYVTTLLGVGGLPLMFILLIIANGAFGIRMDDVLWPLAWLLNGPGASLNRAGNSVFAAQYPILVQIEAVVGQLLVASNPLIAGIASATGLVQGRPIASIEHAANIDIPYVAPWLLFAIQHVLTTTVLIWLTARCLRRATT
jgi:ABC-type transport system involved in multi-copper enzyme maturation permease subunit